MPPKKGNKNRRPQQQTEDLHGPENQQRHDQSQRVAQNWRQHEGQGSESHQGQRQSSPDDKTHDFRQQQPIRDNAGPSQEKQDEWRQQSKKGRGSNQDQRREKSENQSRQQSSQRSNQGNNWRPSERRNTQMQQRPQKSQWQQQQHSQNKNDYPSLGEKSQSFDNKKYSQQTKQSGKQERGQNQQPQQPSTSAQQKTSAWGQPLQVQQSQQPDFQQPSVSKPAAWGKQQFLPSQQIQVEQSANQPDTQQQKTTTSIQQPSTSTTRKDLSSVQKSMGGLKIDDKKLPLDQVTAMIPKRKDPTKAGTLGTKITILANMVELKFGENFPNRIFHYDVKMDPDKPKYLLRKAFEKARMALFANRFSAYDGKCNAYSAFKLAINDPHTVEVKVKNDDDKDVTFKVTFQIASEEINAGWLKECRAGLRDSEKHLTSLQAVNTILSCAPLFRGISVGRSYFTPDFLREGFVKDIGGGMEVWVGLFQSAVNGWKPFLNVDVAHKAFPKKMNLLHALIEVLNLDITRNDTPYNDQNITSSHIKNNIDKLNKYLRSLRVTTSFKNKKNDIEKRSRQAINEIIMKNSKEDFFNIVRKNNEGEDVTEKISVFTYYKEIKKYDIKYPDFPLLWINSRQKNIHVPLEICEIEFGQNVKKVLHKNQTSEMVRFAAQGTGVRKDKINAQLSVIKHNSNPFLKEFDISINNDFEKVPARILDPPKINYRNNLVENVFKGTWRTNKLDNPTDLIRNDKSWGIINYAQVKSDKINAFINMFIKEGRNLGIEIGGPIDNFIDRRLNIDRKDNSIIVSRELRLIIEDFQNLKKKGAKFTFVFFKDNIKCCYEIIKQVAELRVGILTQCITSFTVERKMNGGATMNNILQKINAKLRGSNHFLNLTFLRPNILDKPVMIVGADVTHPAPESNEPSIAAVVASHDPKAYRYSSKLRLQQPKEEMIRDLKEIMKELLLNFERKTGHKPFQIIFYRDGVSEGQFGQVLRDELSAVRQACESFPNYRPPITFLVVQKRHHIRLFPINKFDSDDAHKNFNVKPGTIVDTVITHQTDIDFYLVSHASIQGTSRPTKYRVLWDDANFNEDQIEQLTYYLCHMFTRCTRAVSYPAPTYYAHLAAFRARALTKNVPINLQNLEQEQEKIKVVESLSNEAPMFFV